MGYHVEERAFTPSVTFITTELGKKHENEARFPAVGAHCGAWEEARPGCPVRRVEQLERDLRGAATTRGKTTLVIAKRASANGILRTSRRFT